MEAAIADLRRITQRAQTEQEFRRLAETTGATGALLGAIWNERPRFAAPFDDEPLPMGGGPDISPADDELADLPAELLREIALRTNPRALQDLCAASKRFARICADPTFWRARYTAEFGKPSKQPDDWRRTYLIRALRIFTTRRRIARLVPTMLNELVDTDDFTRAHARENPHLIRAVTEYVYELYARQKFLEEPEPGVIAYRPEVVRVMCDSFIFRVIAGSVTSAFIWTSEEHHDIVDEAMAGFVVPSPMLVIGRSYPTDAFLVAYDTGETVEIPPE